MSTAIEEAEISHPFLQSKVDAREPNLNLALNQILLGLANSLGFSNLKGKGVVVDEVTAQKLIPIKTHPGIVIKDKSQSPLCCPSPIPENLLA